jgi:carbon monoxide dehydrogenase subunit G
VIDRPPGEVWAVVGDVGEIRAWLPFIAESASTGDGGRLCHTPDGGVIRERIVEHDPAARRYSYVIDEAPMPIAKNTSTIEVHPDGSGARVVWTTEVEPDELAIYREGLASLKAQLESS